MCQQAVRFYAAERTKVLGNNGPTGFDPPEPRAAGPEETTLPLARRIKMFDALGQAATSMPDNLRRHLKLHNLHLNEGSLEPKYRAFHADFTEVK